MARAGDFFIVPPETIHQETTSQDSDLEAFIVRVRGQPEKVDAAGPEISMKPLRKAVVRPSGRRRSHWPP